MCPEIDVRVNKEIVMVACEWIVGKEGQIQEDLFSADERLSGMGGGAHRGALQLHGGHGGGALDGPRRALCYGGRTIVAKTRNRVGAKN